MVCAGVLRKVALYVKMSTNKREESERRSPNCANEPSYENIIVTYGTIKPET